MVSWLNSKNNDYISNLKYIAFIAGIINCLNDEDCLGANKLCFRNATMHVGKCVCKEGYKPAKEDPIKCLNIGKIFEKIPYFVLIT